MAVIDVKDSTFESEVLKSDKPVLVDFWAVWCPPCRMQSPIVDEIAEERPDIKVCKVNVDECPQLSQKYDIDSIPTLMVFEGGRIKATLVGLRPKEQILAEAGL